MKLFIPFFLTVFTFFQFSNYCAGQGAVSSETAPLAFQLDVAKVAAKLATAPDVFDRSSYQNAPTLELPMEDGKRKVFQMYKSHPMHPELAAQFPEIQTYHGKCSEDGVSGVSVTISPNGLQAMVLNERFEKIFIQPAGGADLSQYISYVEPANAFSNYMCAYEHGGLGEAMPPKPSSTNTTAPPATAEFMVNSPLAMGDKLRTYRLAMSCTGEFGQENGGTKPLVLAVMVANVNAINLIYIREMAIQFQLIANNEDIIYLDGATDPFLNDGQYRHPPGPGGGLDDLDNNITNTESVIGTANYDIGHLMQAPPPGACNGDPGSGFSGCGGWAGAGPCLGSKAGGFSVNSIGILIHEMGHQFWMPHTTDGSQSTRYDNIAIGNTIMGRNDGLPGNNNYFHVSSTDIAATEVEDVSHCVPGVATGNTIPTVTVGAGGMHIPKSTPFILSGSATDPDPNTTLVYNWQQYNNDLLYDTTNNRITPLEDNPVFRNYFPTADGNVRYIPRLLDLVNNNIPFSLVDCDPMGNNCDTFDLEGLPTLARNLTFRLVARDFEPDGGAFDYATLSFEVDGGSGPFVVTSPNTGNPTWTAGNSVTIDWNVANTNNAPVSCATVDIMLSYDGGYTYPYTLAAGTANDGSHTFTLPAGLPETSTARVKVACATYDNVVFFDISNENFTISSTCKAAGGVVSPADDVTATAGDGALDLNPAPIYGLANSTTAFSVAATGMQTQFALWNTAQTACEVGCCANYYSTLQFQVDRAGTYTFDEIFDGPTTGFLSIHNGVYDPNDVCANFITSNWRATAGVELVNPFEAALVAGQAYTMVFHPWFGETTATGTVTITNSIGGNIVYLGQGPPPPAPAGDYGYTYAAVNTANDQIAAVSSGADFTSLAAGTYHVYGLSYKSANPPPAVVDPNSFLNMTIEAAIGTNQCIVFSHNFIKMTITPGACTPPSMDLPFVTQPTCATPTGTIVINATGSGTLEYSVDDGVNWSTNAINSGLAPGSYNLKARLQSDPTCMTTWALNPVVLNTPTGCCTPPTVNAPTVTQPSCMVANGVIVVDATGGGTLEYSVDDGTNWQLSSTFDNLAVGNYNIKVRLQSDPTCMTTYASNPVVLSNSTNDPCACNAYCTASQTSGTCAGPDEFISNVTFNTINNNSDCAQSLPDGYTDYTNISTAVTAGSSYMLNVTNGTSAFPQDECRAWFDWNGNGDFTDPGEEFVLTGSGNNNVEFWDVNVPVPAGATLGSTRMRVRITYDAVPTPCGVQPYSETEDYCITINAAGVAAEALDFDGSDDYVAMPANLTSSLTNFTFEAWVYWDGSNNWQRIMDCGINTNTYMYLTPKGFPGDNPIFAITTSSSGGEERITSSVSAAIGQWQHYAVVLDFEASTGTMYLDGVQVGQNTNMTLSPLDLGNLPNNYLGKSQWADPYLDGKMDEVRFWDYAKTASQVACQKDVELMGNEPGLLVYYNFDQGIAGGSNPGVTMLDDLTAGNNDGTLTNFALNGAGSNWVEPGAPLQAPGPACCPAGNVLFVNDGATGANNGTSWADAFTDLQFAIAAGDTCENITEIWVAAGTYKPTNGTDQTISFSLKNNLALYGGFVGTETAIGDRPSDPTASPSVLSGDIGVAANNSDNSYHVIKNENIGNSAMLDRFFIIGGVANGTGSERFGGGMLNTSNASPTLNHCFFVANAAIWGGAMYNNVNSSPVISGCAFVSNTVSGEGGGMYNSLNSSPAITNSLFQDNSSTGIYGGGAIFNTGDCATTLMNCTLEGNMANNGAGIWNQFSSVTTVTNSIFWNNIGGTSTVGTIFSYSLIPDAACPGGNTCNDGMIYNTDPLFVSGADVHLQDCSPAKNVATATGAPTIDYEGDARPQGTGIDMGYDESLTACSCPDNRVVSGEIPSDTYQAAIGLMGNALVKDGETIYFKAGDSIELLPGAEVQLGGVLEATIEACSPLSPNEVEEQ